MSADKFRIIFFTKVETSIKSIACVDSSPDRCNFFAFVAAVKGQNPTCYWQLVSSYCLYVKLRNCGFPKNVTNLATTHCGFGVLDQLASRPGKRPDKAAVWSMTRMKNATIEAKAQCSHKWNAPYKRSEWQNVFEHIYPSTWKQYFTFALEKGRQNQGNLFFSLQSMS